MSTTDPDPFTNAILSFGDAVALIKRTRGKTYHLHATTWVPFKVQNPAKYPVEDGYNASSTVPVSKTDLLYFLEHAIRPHVRDKVNIRVSYCKRLLFVGQSV